MFDIILNLVPHNQKSWISQSIKYYIQLCNIFYAYFSCGLTDNQLTEMRLRLGKVSPTLFQSSMWSTTLLMWYFNLCCVPSKHQFFRLLFARYALPANLRNRGTAANGTIRANRTSGAANAMIHTKSFSSTAHSTTDAMTRCTNGSL